ncbi:hypothetical protein BsWGS_08285 [Bradybaena similaris]
MTRRCHHLDVIGQRLAGTYHNMKSVVLPIVAIVLLAGISQCFGVPALDCKEGNLVECFVEPCMVNKCSAVPEATCRDDYCGGCKARWYLDDNEVTAKCTTA